MIESTTVETLRRSFIAACHNWLPDCSVMEMLGIACWMELFRSLFVSNIDQLPQCASCRILDCVLTAAANPGLTTVNQTCH